MTTENNIYLKPCPFCGCKDVEFYKDNERGYTVYEVNCINCDAILKLFDVTETEAIAHWNSRTRIDEILEGKNKNG